MMREEEEEDIDVETLDRFVISSCVEKQMH